jgi:hypothetical protein
VQDKLVKQQLQEAERVNALRTREAERAVELNGKQLRDATNEAALAAFKRRCELRSETRLEILRKTLQ